jgi:hypothetical protein
MSQPVDGMLGGKLNSAVGAAGVLLSGMHFNHLISGNN